MRYMKYSLIIIVILLLTAISSLLFLLFHTQPYTLDYVVAPLSVNDQSIEVSVTLNNIRWHQKGQIELCKTKTAYDITCYDNKGNDIGYLENDDFIVISTTNASSVKIIYKVRLGGVDKHGYRGGLYDDMLVFDGEYVLMIPHVASTGIDEDIRKQISSVTISYEVPDSWIRVIPFIVTDANGMLMTEKTDPAGSDFYELLKACYAFGRFEEDVYEKDGIKLSLYIDSEYSPLDVELAQQGISSLYAYYYSLFGYAPPELSIVLLRQDPYDGAYLMGGNGSQVLGSTFNPGIARDWQLMGHRFFHSFYNVKGDPTDFLSPGRLWFYEGLSSYYENMSMDALPASIRDGLDLGSQNGLYSLFNRYVYMYIKDSYLRLTPLGEEEILQIPGLSEFLHYIQAPLVIKGIEDLSYAIYGSYDRMLRYIIGEKDSKISDLVDILTYAMNESAQVFAEYFIAGNELLPLWYIANEVEEDPDKVISDLNDIEYTLYTWLSLTDPDYPADIVFGKDLDSFVYAARDNNVHFASDETEDNILRSSFIVYAQLMKYALRAEVCGIAFDDPELRYKLLGDAEKSAVWGGYARDLVGKSSGNQY